MSWWRHNTPRRWWRHSIPRQLRYACLDDVILNDGQLGWNLRVRTCSSLLFVFRLSSINAYSIHRGHSTQHRPSWQHRRFTDGIVPLRSCGTIHLPSTTSCLVLRHTHFWTERETYATRTVSILLPNRSALLQKRVNFKHKLSVTTDVSLQAVNCNRSNPFRISPTQNFLSSIIEHGIIDYDI